MKKLIMLSIFAFIGLSIKAQKTNEGVKFTTLKYMLDNLSVENSDEYFSQKGYTFDGTHELNDGTILTHYQHIKSSKTLSMGINNDVKIMVGLSSLPLCRLFDYSEGGKSQRIQVFENSNICL